MLSEFDQEEKKDENIEEDEDITIIELEGVQYELLDTVKYKGNQYIAITPFDEDLLENGDEDTDFTILEMSEDPDNEDGCILKTVDDEDLYSRVGDLFLDRFAEYDTDDE